jgi:hypothetical protein
MKSLLAGLMMSVGLVGWAQLPPAPPQGMEPPPNFAFLEYVFSTYLYVQPGGPTPVEWLVPPGFNNFSVDLSQDLSVDLSVDLSQDLSTCLAVSLAQDLSTVLAVNYGQDLSTNLAVNLGQNLATPTWR